jgi:hypothetical protein
MKNFIRHFVRLPAGMWTCVSSVDLQTAQGRVQVASGTHFGPGTLFMGIDVVAMLEDEVRRRNSHAGPPISQSPQDSMQGLLPLLSVQ